MAVNFNVKFIDPEWMFINYGTEDPYTGLLTYVNSLPMVSRYSYLDSIPEIDSVPGRLLLPDSAVYVTYYAESTDGDFGEVNYIINYDQNYLVFQDFIPGGGTTEDVSFFFWGLLAGVAVSPTPHTCFDVVFTSNSNTYQDSACIEITGGGWRIGSISMS